MINEIGMTKTEQFLYILFNDCLADIFSSCTYRFTGNDEIEIITIDNEIELDIIDKRINKLDKYFSTSKIIKIENNYFINLNNDFVYKTIIKFNKNYLYKLDDFITLYKMIKA